MLVQAFPRAQPAAPAREPHDRPIIVAQPKGALAVAKSKEPKGYRATQEDATDLLAHELLQSMRDQLLIVLIQRLGGEITVQPSEIDATGNLILTLKVDGGFMFGVAKKN